MKNIIISRTDSIGDVVLTLPLAKVLKDHFSDIKIAFLGKSYTRPVIDACEYIDEFIDVKDFLQQDVEICGLRPEAILHVFPVAAVAKRAKHLRIPLRIGTTNRLFHWTNCNKLIWLSRKNSLLHEAQLNLKLLSTLGIHSNYELKDVNELISLTRIQCLPERLSSYIHPTKYNLILHPKSQGSAREWGIANFVQLIQLLDKDRYNIIISGTEKERTLLTDLFDNAGSQVSDVTGMMSLEEFISFINRCDGIVANSTGPLHIAAVLGKDALGIYPPIRPMHPGRWAPIGKKAHVFVENKECNNCRKDERACLCVKQILPLEIKAVLDKAQIQKNDT